VPADLTLSAASDYSTNVRGFRDAGLIPEPNKLDEEQPIVVEHLLFRSAPRSKVGVENLTASVPESGCCRKLLPEDFAGILCFRHSNAPSLFVIVAVVSASARLFVRLVVVCGGSLPYLSPAMFSAMREVSRFS